MRRHFVAVLGAISVRSGRGAVGARIALIGDGLPVSCRAQAAEKSGFRIAHVGITESSWREAMADPEVAAVGICAPQFGGADHVAEAVAAGKHVWVEAPRIESQADAAGIARRARASGIFLAAGRPDYAGESWQRTRHFVQNRTTGVTFCRVIDSNGEWMEHAQAALGNPAAGALASQGRRAIIRYPGVTVEYERSNGGREGAWFYGSVETLALTPPAAVLLSNSAAERFEHPPLQRTLEAHWTAFRLGLESGREPAFGLEGYARSARIRQMLLGSGRPDSGAPV